MFGYKILIITIRNNDDSIFALSEIVILIYAFNLLIFYLQTTSVHQRDRV